MSSTSTTDSRETTPSPSPPPVPKRKKSSKRNELKWFKGTPNKTRTPKKLLKHAQKESSPQQLPIPARVVEFDIDGHTERLGVSEILSIIDKGSVNYDLPQTPDLADDSSNQAFPTSGTPLASTSKAGKGKGALKRPKPKVNSTPKITINPNNNWNITENSESNSNTAPNKLPEGNFSIMDDYKPRIASPMPNSYIRYMEKHPEELENEVEYDIDEEDYAWLELVNDKRHAHKLHPVLPEDMEFLLDRLEKESYFQMQSTGMEQAPLIDDDAVCCICMDGECQNSNAILFCDMCNLAVHQECYGVPYIPEGQWLCRRCLQSPSRAVDCALCPNKGGAFKQTDDGRWAHVICAIWIPEVCFANTVFLEPIDSVSNIPAARWKLCCYICKQKGVGACIQCQKTNCYTAFHVTCAQQANLCMNMDTVVDGNAVIVKKTAYCDHHAPPDERGDDSPRHKLKQTRKMLAEKRCAIPVVSIPTIPSDRMEEISNEVHFLRKHQFIKRLMAYWKLKRQQRNGVPLLRRLQAASTASTATTISNRDESRSFGSAEFGSTLNYYHYWVRMRQDLEKARLLCELIRKRERLKRSFVHLKHQEVNLTLKPFNSILLNVVDELMARDVSEIFCEPVDTNEVVDYLDVIKKPMDLSTIKEKVNSFEYLSIDELEKDFDLMIRNCLMYNGKDTIFYKAGLRLRELGGVVIRQARRLINSIGFDRVTGLHLENRVCELPVLEDGEILEKVENFLENEERFTLPLEKHLTELQNLMDETLALTHPLKRKNRFAKVRNELIRLRKLKTHNDDPGICFKEYLDSKHNSFFLTGSDPTCAPMLNCDPSIELFRVGVSPSKRVERAQERDSGNTSAYETRTLAMQRSKNRSLRPLKRKILTESPLKDSPVKESPVKESPTKSMGGLFYSISVPNLRTANRTRRSSISPTRKSQRISSAQDTQAQQIEPPAPSKPVKLSVNPTNKVTPSPPKISRKASTSDVISPQSKHTPEELLEQKKSRHASSESAASPTLNNSFDHIEHNFEGYDDDGDFHKSQPVRLDPRSPSPAPSNKSSSGSSISSLIRFDAPEIRFDRFGTHHEHEPGTIPIIVSPTRPIEVITTYSSGNNRLSPGKDLMPVKKGSSLFIQRSARLHLSGDETSENDNDSDVETSAKSSVAVSSSVAFNSPTKKGETPSSSTKISSQFRTPESQKLKPSNSKRKSVSNVNVTPKSSTSSASNRRVISFTSPPPLKTASPAQKSPKTEPKAKNKFRENDEPSIAKLSKILKQPLSPDVTDYKSPTKISKSVSPKSKQVPKPSSPKNRTVTQTPRRPSPFLASTTKKAKLMRSPSKQVATPKKSGASSRSGSPTKSSPRTPKNKIVKKRLSMSDTSQTKQKKANLIRSGQNRLSRSLSQTDYRAQSRSPSITSIVRREPAGGFKNRLAAVNNVNEQRVSASTSSIKTPVEKSTSNLKPNSFSAYRAPTPKEPESNSDEDHEDGNATEHDKGDVQKDQEIESEEEANSEKDKETEGQNGTCTPLVLESLLTPERNISSPARNAIQRTEAGANEGILCLAPIKALTTSNTANRLGPAKPTGSDIHVLNNLNTNERVPRPHSPSPEPDLLDLSDDEGPQVNNTALARYENYKPQSFDLVWAVYEFRSWFPAIVINPDGPFGLFDNGLKIPQPPPEVILKKPMSTDPLFLVSYFELKQHWKWVEANQVKPLASDTELDNFFLGAKSMLDLKEVKKAYERALLHRCRARKPDGGPIDPDPDDINGEGELLDVD